MKSQALFSSKDKSKKLKCHLLQFLFGTLRVNSYQKLHLKLMTELMSLEGRNIMASDYCNQTNTVNLHLGVGLTMCCHYFHTGKQFLCLPVRFPF